MKIAICCHEADGQLLRRWLREQDEDGALSISLFRHSEELLRSYQQQYYYDLIFWDCQGAEDQLARMLRQRDNRAGLIFLCDRPPQGQIFEAAVCLRPLQRETVLELFWHFREIYLWHTPEITLAMRAVDGQRELLHINVRDILYIESDLRMVYVHTIYPSKYECYGPISALEQLLKERNFFRAHKSYLINLHYVCYIGADQVGLLPPDHRFAALPISRRRRGALKDALWKLWQRREPQKVQG